MSFPKVHQVVPKLLSFVEIEKKWKTEIEFIKYIDIHNKVLWWFKNGDKGRIFFAVLYDDNNFLRTFYVDFIK